MNIYLSSIGLQTLEWYAPKSPRPRRNAACLNGMDVVFRYAFHALAVRGEYDDATRLEAVHVSRGE